MSRILSEPQLSPPCPVCQHRLQGAFMPAWMNGGKNKHEVWCGHGPCPSQAANDGADGETLEEAMQKLKASIDEEDCEQDHNVRAG